MVTRKLTGWCVVFLFVTILYCPSPAISQKNEDTAQLSFQKTAISKKKLDTYTVKKGDWIFNIIRQKFGGTEKDILKILKQVKRLNPKIKNIHKINPGQKLILPSEELLLYNHSFSQKQPTKKIPRKTTAELQAGAKEGSTSTYIVKEGDSLSDIINGELKASHVDIYQVLRTVKRLNPNIKNINKIRPGQELLLPFAEKKRAPAEEIKAQRAFVEEVKEESLTAEEVKVETAPATEVKVEAGPAGEIKTEDIPGPAVTTGSPSTGEVTKENASAAAVEEDHTPFLPGGKIVVPRVQKDVTGKKVVKKQLKKKKEKVVKKKKQVVVTEKQIAVLRYILSRITGAVIAKGNYFIPLFPSGQITVDCSAVPVVEFDNGMTILLDFSGRIPAPLKQVIESTWKNYVIIDLRKDQTILSTLEAVIAASKDYSFNAVRAYKKIGTHPPVNIYVDWIVSEKKAGGRKPYSFGIKSIDNNNLLLPGNIREYTDKKGFEVIELLGGTEVKGITDTYEDMNVPALRADTNVALAESLLSALGYSSVRNSDVTIYNMKEHGFTLSVKVDLLLNIDTKKIIIHSKNISPPFVDVLKKRGTPVVFLSETDTKRRVFEKLLHAINAPFLADTFKFSFSKGNAQKGGEIILSAIRTKGKGGSLYFINRNIDNGIYGLLHKKWGVNLVSY
jgi:hypothetical protein